MSTFLRCVVDYDCQKGFPEVQKVGFDTFKILILLIVHLSSLDSLA